MIDKEISVFTARKKLTSMFPRYIIDISCSMYADNTDPFWSITISEMRDPACLHCQSAQKIELAKTYVSKSYTDAEAAIVAGMAIHGIVPKILMDDTCGEK